MDYLSEKVGGCTSLPGMYAGIIEATPVNNAGTYSIGQGSAFMHTFAKDDLVTISNCGTDSTNNGDYRIFNVAGNQITLINKDTNSSIATKISNGCRIKLSVMEIAPCIESVGSIICCVRVPEILGASLPLSTSGGINVTFSGLYFDSPESVSNLNGVIVSSVSTDGTYKVDDEAWNMSSYEYGDAVMIVNCSNVKKSRNNGAFKISDVNATHITVVNLSTFEEVLTDANISGCSLQKSNLLVVTNNRVWGSTHRINSTHIFASSPVDVGREIPVIVAINGRVSRYNTMFLSHFLPNVTSIPKIPLLSGGPSSRLRLIVDEIGDYTTLPRLKVLVASEEQADVAELNVRV